MLTRFLNWFRGERHLHNARDYNCIYWWGDRGGYVLDHERCGVCRFPRG